MGNKAGICMTLALIAIGFHPSTAKTDDWEVCRTCKEIKKKPRRLSVETIDALFAFRVRAGHFARARVLRFRHGGHQANPDAPRSKDGLTLLMDFALKGDAKRVEFLLKMGADPNLADPIGMTALAHAARAGRIDTVGKLLETPGIDLGGALGPELKSRPGFRPRFAPLWLAAFNGHHRVVRALLERDATLVTQTSGIDEETALIGAARGCSPESAAELIDRGADVNTRDRERRTAAMHAAGLCCLDENPTLAVLVEHGADLTLKAKPYRHASVWGYHRTERDASHFASRSECIPNFKYIERLLGRP